MAKRLGKAMHARHAVARVVQTSAIHAVDPYLLTSCATCSTGPAAMCTGNCKLRPAVLTHPRTSATHPCIHAPSSPCWEAALLSTQRGPLRWSSVPVLQSRGEAGRDLAAKCWTQWARLSTVPGTGGFHCLARGCRSALTKRSHLVLVALCKSCIDLGRLLQGATLAFLKNTS